MNLLVDKGVISSMLDPNPYPPFSFPPLFVPIKVDFAISLSKTSFLPRPMLPVLYVKSETIMDRETVIKEFLSLAADFFDKATVLLAEFRQKSAEPALPKPRKVPRKSYTKSAYQLFADSRFPAFTDSTSMGEKAKIIGTEWRGLSEAEKNSWRVEAKKLKNPPKPSQGSATSPVPVSDSEDDLK